jgi:hypothetical protein
MLREVAIFQDYNSLSGADTTPTHDFNMKFEPGKSYALTVGALGGGGGMSNGVTFEISLYYRDAASNRVTVAATSITNTPALFPTNTHLTDFQVIVPAVKASDAWAGKNIGIQLESTVGFDLQGGYWDVDNVRLTESTVPNGSFESPPTDFASPLMDEWQKAPQPAREIPVRPSRMIHFFRIIPVSSGLDARVAARKLSSRVISRSAR